MSFIFIFSLIFFFEWHRFLSGSNPWSPTSCTKSNTQSAHKNSPVSETFLFSFLGTRSLHHRSRLRKRFFGWHRPLKGPALSPPSLVQSPTPDQRIKTVQFPKQFYSFLGGTRSLHHRSRLRKRLFGWHQPRKGPALSLPSLVQSLTPDQRIKTVQCPKQFYSLFWDQVLASQIKTKEEIVWVTPTP